jgi:hypothetical protein
MAKRAVRSSQVPEKVESGAEHPNGPTTDAKIEEFAEDLGRLLGTARAKAEGWIGQRQSIAKHLEAIRDTASGLLAQLTSSGSAAAPRRRPGRPRGTKKPQPGPNLAQPISRKKKRKMSAKGRAAIAAAQRARWAKIKAAK